MPDGIVVIDKPQGWTSMDVCAKLRGVFHEKRVGHAGTLDPMATGVLPVFVGQATKAIPFAEGGRKRYEAVLRLGTVTDTQDVTGTVLSRAPVTVTEEDLRAVLPQLTGEISQLPPMYSAIKVGGRRLYDAARRGEVIERAPRPVTIYELTLTERLSETDYALRVVCSKGTYVRTLCHDLGALLGCGGTMAALRRTEASGFTLAQAIPPEEAERRGAEILMPIDSLFAAYPAYTVPDAETERRCRCGNPVAHAALPDGRYRVYAPGGEFLSLSRAEGGTLTAERNFFGA